MDHLDNIVDVFHMLAMDGGGSVGIDEFRSMVDEELQEDWAQKSFYPTRLLFIEDEEADAPTPSAGGYTASDNSPEFNSWVESNVSDQKQDGYKTALVKLKLGDIQAEQFGQLADLSRKYAGGRVRITHQQNMALRWVPEGALYESQKSPWLRPQNDSFPS